MAPSAGRCTAGGGGAGEEKRRFAGAGQLGVLTVPGGFARAGGCDP